MGCRAGRRIGGALWVGADGRMIGGGAAVGDGGAVGTSSPNIRRKRSSQSGGAAGGGVDGWSSVGGSSPFFSARRLDNQFAMPLATTRAMITHGLSNRPAAMIGVMLTKADGYLWPADGGVEPDGSRPSLPMFSRMVVSACTFLMR